MGKVIFDSFRNFLTGFNVPWKDSNTQTRAYLQLVHPNELEALYRGDWIAQKIVRVPALDSTRAWRQWQGSKEQISALEDCERELGIQQKLQQALIRSRLYGGAVMIMGIKGQEFTEELDPESVGKDDLLFVHVVSRWHLGIGPLVRDITSKWYGQPTYYQRSDVPILQPPGGVTPLEESKLGGSSEAGSFFIHPSRCIRLLGVEYPDYDNSPDSWGDSVLQGVYQAVRNAGMISHAIAYMMNEAKLDIIKIPNLGEDMSTEEGAGKLRNRFMNANMAKSVVNALLIDKEEEWECRQLNVGSLETVLNTYLSICAGAADIPATRLLGVSPSGMDATGDSDTRNYYDRISADQMMRLTPALTPLDEVLIRHTFGSRPQEIHYRWQPLWQESDTEKAAMELQKAQAYQIDVSAMLINPDVLRDGRVNSLIESGFLYPGLEESVEQFGAEHDEEEIMERVLAQQGTSPDLEEQKSQSQREHELNMAEQSKPEPGEKKPPPGKKK